MKDQSKTPGAKVQITHEQLRDLVAGYCGPSALGDLYALADAPAEQAPAVGGDLSKDHVFRELVNSLRDLANQYYKTEQLRERVSTVLRSHLAPLLAEIAEERKWRRAAEGGWREANRVIAMQRERLDILEAQIAKANDWSHLKPDMDPPKP